MIKEIYVYFSDRDFLPEFRQHPDFVPSYKYSIYERPLCLREEYGKLRLKNGMNLRLILDSGRETTCPWCGFPDPDIIIEGLDMGYIMGIFAQCPKCLARGPFLNVNPDLMNDQIIINEVKEMVKEKWRVRIPKSVKPPIRNETTIKE